MLEGNSRYAYSWQSSELRDTLRGRYCMNVMLDLEGVVKGVWRSIGRPRSSKSIDALAHYDSVSLDTDLEAMIEWASRCTWRPRSSKSRDELPGQDQGSLERYIEVVLVWHTGCWKSIHGMVNLRLWVCDKVTLPLSVHRQLVSGGWSCRVAH